MKAEAAKFTPTLRVLDYSSLDRRQADHQLTDVDLVIVTYGTVRRDIEQLRLDRTHRIGQTKEVLAYRLIAEDTVEDKVLALQDTKRALADAVLSANPVGLASLSASELEFLLG